MFSIPVRSMTTTMLSRTRNPYLVSANAKWYLNVLPSAKRSSEKLVSRITYGNEIRKGSINRNNNPIIYYVCRYRGF